MSRYDYSTRLARALSDIREHAAPAPDDPLAVRSKCAECGEWFYRWRKHPKRRCATCSGERAARVAREMGSKSGPAYERAVRKQFAFWSGEMARLGLTPPGSS